MIKMIFSHPFKPLKNEKPLLGTISHLFVEQIFWETFPDNQNHVVEILALITGQTIPTTSSFCGFAREELLRYSNEKTKSCASDDARITVCLDQLIHCRLSPTEKVVREICSELEESFDEASSKGIHWTARYNPLYGQIYRLRSVLEHQNIPLECFNRMYINVMDICWKISDFVNAEFADHTQEFSMDNEVINDESEGTTAQMLFVCCWRCIREIALLFGGICLMKTGEKCVELGEVSKILDWMVSQLLITRHTGTFETLAEQIAKICRLLVASRDQKGTVIVVSHLDSVVKEISGNWNSPLKPENTRKSAGIPRLLCIMFSCLRRTEIGEEKFLSVCGSLLRIARGNSTSGDSVVNQDDRVRAVNMLEAIFRENPLNELSERFLSDGLMVACDEVASDIWSVRNAAASLFTGLMQRVFGPGVKKDRKETQWREYSLSCATFFKMIPGKKIASRWKCER